MTDQSDQRPGRPSQAEGERETVEDTLGARARGGAERAAPQQDPPPRPSQAEGERETVEDTLRDKERI